MELNGWNGNNYYRDGKWIGSLSKGYVDGKVLAAWHRPCLGSHPMNEMHVDTVEQAKELIERLAET